ncbi:hypothetical protein PIB30_020917 [Stylosanthes scabra]|uniref:F-box associated domain-containing protein n=1 Tax=Stylosanthes scabra TaxID=79078 RepID=A0ABU6Y7E3_9FABA|nr:hypothetical protein [Stylosanthes scabra]
MLYDCGRLLAGIMQKKFRALKWLLKIGQRTHVSVPKGFITRWRCHLKEFRMFRITHLTVIDPKMKPRLRTLPCNWYLGFSHRTTVEPVETPPFQCNPFRFKSFSELMDENIVLQNDTFEVVGKEDPRSVVTNTGWETKRLVVVLQDTEGPDFARQNWIANEHRSSTALLGHGYSSYSEKCHWATQVNAGDDSVNIVRLPFEIREAGYFTIVGSDNGNICVTYSETGEDRELLVLNTLTKKYVHVDDESYKYYFYRVSVYAFGYLKDSTEFRVIYVYKNNFRDKSLSWMSWDSRLQYWRTRGVYVTKIEKVGPTSMVVNGVVFWIGWGGFFNLEPTHLLAFSLEKEIFFQEPILKDNINTYNSIIKINNELGFVSYNDIGLKRKLDVWNIHFIEEDNFEWQKLYHIEDFGIPYTPSFINEQEIITLLDTRTTPTDQTMI